MEDRLGLLRKTHLFGSLSDQDLRRVAALLKERSVRARTTIYRQGDQDPNLYIVASGRLKVWTRDERGRERDISRLRPGDCFGTHSLLTGERRDVTVDVEEPAVVLYLEKRDFDSLLDDQPDLRRALFILRSAAWAAISPRPSPGWACTPRSSRRSATIQSGTFSSSRPHAAAWEPEPFISVIRANRATALAVSVPGAGPSCGPSAVRGGTLHGGPQATTCFALPDAGPPFRTRRLDQEHSEVPPHSSQISQGPLRRIRTLPHCLQLLPV